MPHLRILIVGSLMMLVAGCSWEWIPIGYHLDIHQGNIVSQQMVDQLRPGMTRRQAAFIMGEALLKDPFHDDRWDYIYSNQPGGDVRIQKNITLLFKGDELAGLKGDFRPGTLPSIELKKDTTVTVPPIDHEQTVWEKMMWLLNFGGD